jgi:hypothetical protein
MVEELLADEGRMMASKGVQKARRLLGLSEEQVRTAIRRSRDEVRSGRGLPGEMAAKHDESRNESTFTQSTHHLFVNSVEAGDAFEHGRLSGECVRHTSLHPPIGRHMR